MKAIAYSLMALLLFSLLLSVAITQANYFVDSQATSMRKMSADGMSSLESAIEQDLDKAIDVAARRAIVTAVNYVAAEGAYLNNSETDIGSLTLNGAINGTNQPIMQNNSLANWADNVRSKAAELGMTFIITFESVNVSLSDAFTLKVEATANITLSDKLNVSSFNRKKTSSALVSLEGFEDPVYTINTEARVLRSVHMATLPPRVPKYVTGSLASGHRSGTAIISPGSAGTDSILVCANASAENLAGFVAVVSECSNNCTSGVSIDYIAGAASARTLIPANASVFLDPTSKAVYGFANLTVMIDDGLYNASSDGPSFLDRLEGKLNNTRCASCGLESFVNLLDLSANDLTIKSGQSVIDYLYFSNATHSGSAIRGLSYWSSEAYYPWFKLDNDTAAKYGVSNLTS